MVDQELLAGWGFPGLSRKAHYFEAGSTTSLCGKWLYVGHRDSNDLKSKDDCAACRRKVEKK